MLEKAGVLCGHEGQHQVPGQAAVRHLNAPLCVKFPQQPAVPGINAGHRGRPVLFDGGEIGQVFDVAVVDQAGGAGPGEYGQKEQSVEHVTQTPGPPFAVVEFVQSGISHPFIEPQGFLPLRYLHPLNLGVDSTSGTIRAGRRRINQIYHSESW